MKITKKLVKANQEAWLKKLESGKFKQGRDKLATLDRNVIKYCCLGVAYTCLPVIEHKKVQETLTVMFKLPGEILYADHLLSDKAQELLGMASRDGSFLFSSLAEKAPKIVAKLLLKYRSGTIPNKSGYISLDRLNDSGVPFRLIAQIIRAEPEGLFKKGWALFDEPR